MSDERLKILEALANGAISADEANARLEALRGTPPAAEPAAAATPSEPEAPAEAPAPAAEVPKAKTQTEPRWLRIHVTDRASQQKRVNISVPLDIVRFGLRLGEKFNPEWRDMSWNELQAAIEEKAGLVLHVEGEDKWVDVLVE